jgi:hypothetical protein
MIYKFVDHANIENIKNYDAYLMHLEIQLSGSFNALSIENKERMTRIFNEKWHPDCYKDGKIRIMGFEIDFTSYLKTFWVKISNYGITEIKAFNEDMIIECSVNPEAILKIVLVE